MTPQEMTKVRDKRIMDALNLEKPDRIPIFMSGQGFFKYVDPKATLADYFRKPKYVDDLLIQAAALPDLAEIDQAPIVRICHRGRPGSLWGRLLCQGEASGPRPAR